MSRAHDPRTPRLLFVLLVALAAATACSDDASPDAGGPPDAASADSGVAPDAGVADSGVLEPRLTIVDVERPVDVTPDGRTALLWQQSTAELFFYELVTETMTLKTTLALPDFLSQQPMAISDTRRIAAIYGFQPDYPGLWDEEGGWLTLTGPFDGCVDTTVTPSITNNVGSAFDVSADGRVAVGFLWKDCANIQAFRWTDSGGAGTMALLDAIGVGVDMTTPGMNRATVVSADGAIVGGFAMNGVVDRSPAVWRADGSGFLLDPADFTTPGEVLAIDATGATVAGVWARPTGGFDGFVWTEAGGVVRFAPSENADASGLYPRAMTADGRHVLGRWTYQPTFFDPADDHAFTWSASKGLRKLADVITAEGLEIPADTRLSSVASISADGTTIIGEAQLPPLPEDPLMLPVLKVFVLVLPPGALDR
ncbi:hypothetical protein L6R52_35665 [Myxococcota bacterium]|nr:hypothetical protein [Myxococcota bacterium]